jgi:NAD(P)H-dependent FMN reductase
LFNANQSVDGDPQRLEAAQHIVQDRLLLQDREAPDITEKPWCASFWPAPNANSGWLLPVTPAVATPRFTADPELYDGTLRPADVVVSIAAAFVARTQSLRTTPNERTAMSTRILALVGSLRFGSVNRQLAEAAVKLAPIDISVEIFEGLADVALYNEDIDQPGAVVAADRLRAEVQCADALLLVTPEYNGTMSAALKNAIDWISRPFGAGTITGKPVAVIGASHGQYGGVWAHDDSRKSARIAAGKGAR